MSGRRCEQCGRHADRDYRHGAGKAALVDREIRRRLAGQYRDRMLELGARELHVDRRRLRALELRLGRVHVRQCRDAGLDLVLGDRERTLESLDLGLVEPHLLIGGAQLEIILRQRDLGRQARGGDIGGARLRLGDIRFDQATDASPDIDRPVRLGSGAVDGVLAAADPSRDGRAGGGRNRLTEAVGAMASGRAGVDRHRGEQRAAVHADRRHRRPIRRFVGLQRLIGDLDLPFQSIEHRIVINRPPRLVAADLARRRGLPALLFLEGGGIGSRRAMIVGADCTGGQRQRQRQRSRARRRARHRARHRPRRQRTLVRPQWRHGPGCMAGPPIVGRARRPPRPRNHRRNRSR